MNAAVQRKLYHDARHGPAAFLDGPNVFDRIAVQQQTERQKQRVDEIETDGPAPLASKLTDQGDRRDRPQQYRCDTRTVDTIGDGNPGIGRDRRTRIGHSLLRRLRFRRHVVRRHSTKQHRYKNDENRRKHQVRIRKRRPPDADHDRAGINLRVARRRGDPDALIGNPQRRRPGQAAVPDHHARIRPRHDQRVLAAHALRPQCLAESGRQNPRGDQPEAPVDPATDARHGGHHEHRRSVRVDPAGQKTEKPRRRRGLGKPIAGQQDNAHLKRELQEPRVPNARQPHAGDRRNPRRPGTRPKIGILRQRHRQKEHEQRQPAGNDHRVGQDPTREGGQLFRDTLHEGPILTIPAPRGEVT